MKTNIEANRNKLKKLYIKYYPGLYPPGAFIAWPENKNKHQTDNEVAFRRTKDGVFIALPVGKQ